MQGIWRQKRARHSILPSARPPNLHLGLGNADCCNKTEGGAISRASDAPSLTLKPAEASGKTEPSFDSGSAANMATQSCGHGNSEPPERSQHRRGALHLPRKSSE